MKQTTWILSDKEISRKEIIEQYIDKRMTQVVAAKRLGIGVRHFRRLLDGYRRDGVAALVSKRRGRPSNNKIAAAVRERALALVREYYSDFGPTFAHEKLAENHRHEFPRFFCVETLRHWMIEAGMHRHRKRRIITVHQSRRRCRHFGDLIQVDGSLHDWFEGRGEPCTLIAFVDDATSAITELRLCNAETTADYMLSLERHVHDYGRPLALYSDRHSIFSNNAKKQCTPQEPSQVGRALRELDIMLFLASTPQAKGRVERLFKTLQDRLPKELRLRGICTIEEANKFLEIYRQAYNERFAKPPQSSHDSHRKDMPCDARGMQLILSKQTPRKLSNNLMCRYNNEQYLIQVDKPSYALRGAKIKVCELLNGEIVLLHKGRELPYVVHKESPSLPTVEDSKTLPAAIEQLLKSHRVGHKPHAEHPWRRRLL